MKDSELFNVEINRNTLDEEWVLHPMKVKEISKRVADAEAERDHKKLELEIIEAELDQLARKESSKTTEAAIKNWIKLRPEYQQKAREHIEANRDFKILAGAAKARSDCKYSLENLSRLWFSDYYSEPYNPQLTEAIVERQISKMNKEATRKMIKRGKKVE